MSLEERITTLDGAVRQMLIEDLPRQRQQVKEAIAHNRLQEAAVIAHTVHGSAAFCKLESLRRSALSLEHSLKENNKNADLIRAFDDDMDRVLHALEHEQNN